MVTIILLFSRHGESEFNMSGRIGGDSRLSPRLLLWHHNNFHHNSNFDHHFDCHNHHNQFHHHFDCHNHFHPHFNCHNHFHFHHPPRLIINIIILIALNSQASQISKNITCSLFRKNTH